MFLESYSKYEVETQSKITELEGVIKNLRIRIETLEGQINELKEEKDQLEAKHVELQSERYYLCLVPSITGKKFAIF